MAEQINVFVENKPGRIKTVTQILADNKIDIRAIVIQDRSNFGVMKMLVNDPRRAQRVLSTRGLACAVKEILAIPIDDSPGGLNKLLEVFYNNNVNILDAYGFVIETGKRAVWCVEVDNVEAVQQVVEKNGFSVLGDAELYEL